MSASSTSPDILDVTLRDGSYLIDFQFTAEDTSVIASALEAAGLRWIEIGHGLGLNASLAGKGRAAASDEEYMAAASQSLRQAKWGMFFIPGIGREEDLRLAARYGMSFVRIGTNITEISLAQPFFALAKELGFMASWNAMKSYAVGPAEFGRQAAQVRRWGADVVYLVDSAGGMYPDDVALYLKAVRDHSDAALGFHGHDNLSLAMANTLRAIEAGATFVDSSLQGMGRSAGNAVTEVLLAILKQRGQLPAVDLNAVMDVGQGLIQPLMRRRGLDPMAVTAGYARFHSSFTAKVQDYARKYHLDPRDLIVRLCQEDQVAAPDALLEQLAGELARDRARRVTTVPVALAATPRAVQGMEALTSVLKELRPRAVKRGKYSALNIVVSGKPLDDLTVSRNIQETATHVIGSLTLSCAAHLGTALKAVDGTVDVVLLDVDPKPFAGESPVRVAQSRLERTLLLTYLDSRVWVDAIEDQVVRLLGEVLTDVGIVVAGDHPRSRMLALRFAERRATVTVLERTGREPLPSPLASLSQLSMDPASPGMQRLQAETPAAAQCLATARAVVVWPAGTPWFGGPDADALAPDTVVLDAGIGGILGEGLEAARRRGARLIRVNIWPTLGGALAAAHESARVCREALGWGVLAAVPVVAGGAMGQRGDVVVDSLREPTRVIGVADGRGGVLFRYNPDDADRVRRVSEEINGRLLRPRLDGEGG